MRLPFIGIVFTSFKEGIRLHVVTINVIILCAKDQDSSMWHCRKKAKTPVSLFLSHKYNLVSSCYSWMNLKLLLNSNYLLISSKIVDWCIPCHITMGYLVRLLYMYSLVIEMALNQHPSDVKFPQFGLSLHVCDNFIQQACYHSW